MIAPAKSTRIGVVRTAILRGIGLLVVWILIAGASPSDLPAGVVAAAMAAWISVVLNPPTGPRIRFALLIILGLRLLFDSVLAGADVARRALDPRLPLNPGLIRYNSTLPHGPLRAILSTIISLVPGTLPVGPAPDGVLLVHCLDVGQPAAASMARDEAALLSALGGAQSGV